MELPLFFRYNSIMDEILLAPIRRPVIPAPKPKPANPFVSVPVYDGEGRLLGVEPHLKKPSAA